MVEHENTTPPPLSRSRQRPRRPPAPLASVETGIDRAPKPVARLLVDQPLAVRAVDGVLLRLEQMTTNDMQLLESQAAVLAEEPCHVGVDIPRTSLVLRTKLARDLGVDEVRALELLEGVEGCMRREKLGASDVESRTLRVGSDQLERAQERLHGDALDHDRQEDHTERDRDDQLTLRKFLVDGERQDHREGSTQAPPGQHEAPSPWNGLSRSTKKGGCQEDHERATRRYGDEGEQNGTPRGEQTADLNLQSDEQEDE